MRIKREWRKPFTLNITDPFKLLRFHTWNVSSITQRTGRNTGHWAYCSRTGNDNRQCAQHSGHFVSHASSSSGATTLGIIIVGDSVYAIRFFLFSPVSFFWLGWADNRFAGKSIRNQIYILVNFDTKGVCWVGNTDFDCSEGC